MPLNVFPAYGLDNSLLTAVLIGLYIRLFFTEWLGWVFSGLVVPGYLAAVILLRPGSAAVIIVEALITFLLVRGMSMMFSATKIGTPVFGRDRFMWLVLVSVGVRVVIEALLIPLFEAFLRRRLGFDLSGGSGFYGIGLVLVPLLANACWKPGLLRGSIQQLVCTSITYFILQGLLLTTNLSLASVASCFERIAVDFAASPKAYLLLVAGALLASRANLRFGWDTSGVVIPGLLCLGWFIPVRLLSTLGEAVLIAIVASLFVRLPRVRDWNIEGPRRVAMLFTIGYVIKFAAVAILGAVRPGFMATELFGIGYLLPSLLAVKIWQRRDPAVILLPAVSLSLAGLGIGSLTGYALMVADAQIQSRSGAVNLVARGDRCGEPVPLLSEVRLARTRVARALPSAAAPRIGALELGSLSGLLSRLHAQLAQGSPSCEQLAAQLGPSALGLRLQPAASPAGRMFYTLHESTPDPSLLRGFGLFALAEKPHGGPLLIVERPLQDLTDATALVALVDLLSADGIVVGGLDQSALSRGDFRRTRDVPLRIAIGAFPGQAITVRAGNFPQPNLSAMISSEIAHTLEGKLGPLTRGGFGHVTADLDLPFASEATLAASLLPKPVHYPDVRSWLDAAVAQPLKEREPLLEKAPPPTSPAVDLLLAEQLVRPLARAHSPVDLEALALRISGAASEAGLTVAIIDGGAGQSHPRIAVGGHGEGLLIQTDSPSGPLLEVSSRLSGITDFAAAVFDAAGAHALLAFPLAIDGVTPGPLSRVATALLALTPPAPDVIIVRAEGARTLGAADCTIIEDEHQTQGTTPSLAQRVTATLKKLDISTDVHTQYDPETVDPPSHLVDLLRLRAKADFVTLRVGVELRERFRSVSLSTGQRLLFDRLLVPSAKGSLATTLAAACSDPAGSGKDVSFADFISDARALADTHHPALLSRMLTRAQAEHVTISIVEDGPYGDTYLVARGQHAAVAVTVRPLTTAAVSVPCSSALQAQIQKAQTARAVSISVGGP